MQQPQPIKAAPWRKIPATAIAIAIFLLSSQSSLPLPPTPFLSPDTIAHFLAYASFALALALWFPRARWSAKTLQTAAFVVIIASLYGLSDETHQYFVPGRDASFGDLIADTAGAIFAAGSVAWTSTRVTARTMAC